MKGGAVMKIIRWQGGVCFLGEEGKAFFEELKNAKPVKYNRKKAIRDAKKALRKQGLFVL